MNAFAAAALIEGMQTTVMTPDSTGFDMPNREFAAVVREAVECFEGVGVEHQMSDTPVYNHFAI